VAVEVIDQVFCIEPKAISSTARLVLLSLASHAHRDGSNARPSVRTIARETSLSPRAIHKALDNLKEKRFIEPVGRTHRGVVHYQVNLAALAQARPDEPVQVERAIDVQTGTRPVHRVQRYNPQPKHHLRWMDPEPVHQVQRIEQSHLHDAHVSPALGSGPAMNDAQTSTDPGADNTSMSRDQETSEEPKPRGLGARWPPPEVTNEGPDQEAWDKFRAVGAKVGARTAHDSN